MRRALVGFLQRAGEPRALGRQLREIGLHVPQPALRGVEAGFRLGKLARKARRFRARLFQHGLLCVLFVLAHLQPLAGAIEIRFEGRDALAGILQTLVEPAVLFAQRVVLACLLRQP